MVVAHIIDIATGLVRSLTVSFLRHTFGVSTCIVREKEMINVLLTRVLSSNKFRFVSC